MRYQRHKQVMELLATLIECLTFVQDNPKSELVSELIQGAFYTLETISPLIKNELPPARKQTMEILAVSIGKVMKDPSSSALSECLPASILLRDAAQNIPHKLHVAFYSYKAAMWSALESVWRAFRADDRCQVDMVAIPHYELGGEGKANVYRDEDDLFPSYVERIPAAQYDPQQRQPDIAFISNPYDAGNKVTRVEETFYSSNLKACCGVLVYVPYFIQPYYLPGQGDDFYLSQGVHNAGMVIAQSAIQRDVFIQKGCHPSKVIALGTPKADSIIYNVKNPPAISDEWKKKIQGKTVFLLNTHSLRVVNSGFTQLHEILDLFRTRDDIFLLWRPHPLTKATLDVYKPELMPQYDAFMQDFQSQPNTLLDDTASYAAAFYLADAMMSDASSLGLEFMVTGKPILDISLTDYHKITENSVVFVNQDDNYRVGDEGMTIERFVDAVVAQEDPKKDLRMKAIQEAFVNGDGTCGQEIHNYVMNRILA